MLVKEPLIVKDPTQLGQINKFILTGNLNSSSTNSIDLNIDLKLNKGHGEGTIYVGKSTSDIFSSADWNVAEKPIPANTNSIQWTVNIPVDEVDFVWAVKIVLEENTDNEAIGIRKIFFSKSNVFSPQMGSEMFPEQSLPQYKDRLETGVCFSGGGTRSLLLSMGQMKYLQEKGYWKQTGYYTSVSGGSWASTIYSYSPEQDPTQLLGPVVPPAEYINQLNDKSVPNMGKGAKPRLFEILLALNFLRATYPYLIEQDEIKKQLEKVKFIKDINDILSPIIQIPMDRIWIDTVGMCYFLPNSIYNIFTPGKETYTLNKENVNQIMESGGSITKLLESAGSPIRTVTQRGEQSTYPPYYIANGLMLRPTDSYTFNNPTYIGHEFTPLYGSPTYDGKWPKRLFYGPFIGGGNALSYTFGQEMVGLINEQGKQEPTLLTMFQDNGYLPSLSVASGISSSAFAGATSFVSGLLPWKDILKYFKDYTFSSDAANSDEPMLDSAHLEGELKNKEQQIEQIVDILQNNRENCSDIFDFILKIIDGGGELVNGITPKSNYFSPVDKSKDPTNTLFNFGDGGLSDNFGLISLLRRGVKRIVVFINTSDAFDVTKGSDGKEDISIDITIPAFFGKVEKTNPLSGQHFDTMHVFNEGDYDELLSQFKTALKNNEAIVAETEHEVLPNKDWDLEGGYKVNVLWYYNSLPQEFTQQAGEEVMRTLIPNKADEGKGGAFPLYGTLSSTLGGLKPFEINMMGNIGYWILENTDDKLQKVFNP